MTPSGVFLPPGSGEQAGEPILSDTIDDASAFFEMTGGDAALSATVSALLFESFEEADLAKMSDTEPPDFFSGEGLPWGGGGGGGDSSSAAADVRQDNPEGLA